MLPNGFAVYGECKLRKHSKLCFLFPESVFVHFGSRWLPPAWLLSDWRMMHLPTDRHSPSLSLWRSGRQGRGRKAWISQGANTISVFKFLLSTMLGHCYKEDNRVQWYWKVLENQLRTAVLNHKMNENPSFVWVLYSANCVCIQILRYA